MKVRNGFVSNSSSSSFVLAFKGKDKDLMKKLEQVFDKPIENHPIKFPTKGISKIIHSSLNDEINSLDDFEDIACCPDSEEQCAYCKKVRQLLKDKYNVHFGSFSDQDDDLERFLCMSDIEYEDEKLYVMQNGGY